MAEPEHRSGQIYRLRRSRQIRAAWAGSRTDCFHGHQQKRHAGWPGHSGRLLVKLCRASVTRYSAQDHAAALGSRGQCGGQVAHCYRVLVARPFRESIVGAGAAVEVAVEAAAVGAAAEVAAVGAAAEAAAEAVAAAALVGSRDQTCFSRQVGPRLRSRTTWCYGRCDSNIPKTWNR